MREGRRTLNPADNDLMAVSTNHFDHLTSLADSFKKFNKILFYQLIPYKDILFYLILMVSLWLILQLPFLEQVSYYVVDLFTIIHINRLMRVGLLALTLCGISFIRQQM